MGEASWQERARDDGKRRGPSDGAMAIGVSTALAVLVAWDASGLDVLLAAPLAGPGGFFWRDHWLATAVLHEGGRWVSWLMALWLCIGVGWPTGVLRMLPLGRRAQFAATALLSVALVSLLKSVSGSSCPWELQQFGGGLAQHLSHWQTWLADDGGSGHCFPAGHASSGFAFVGGYFAFRGTSPRVARAWLAGAMAAGLLLGLAQQLRGAHFMSHTLWTAWLCWTAAWAVDAARSCFAADDEADE